MEISQQYLGVRNSAKVSRARRSLKFSELGVRGFGFPFKFDNFLRGSPLNFEKFGDLAAVAQRLWKFSGKPLRKVSNCRKTSNPQLRKLWIYSSVRERIRLFSNTFWSFYSKIIWYLFLGVLGGVKLITLPTKQHTNTLRSKSKIHISKR